ncbi:ornithine carbamoyltransferase/carbamoyltransferase [Lentzea fradiae]|uniref:Ornithine carbamoyltransferase/carbamoyltransferase n=1 Tax=Lentzea fradiae TaxID=200378 RepID=A0A1G8CTG8_9PSEU|nr:ornithine carbamoyltransferase [Lentzea fradiae]SDH48766.1 ornithine carbamoyltransferase/carbamoyltransferase [Lentzea fradiae]
MRTPDTTCAGVSGLLSNADLTADEVAVLVERAGAWFRDGPPATKPLDGTFVGIWFELTSTRTRTAFSVGAGRLGATPVPLSGAELQTSTGETPEDTARVLGGMVDGIVVRSTHSTARLAALEAAAGVPFINAMAEDEHPTQGLCDLATLAVHFPRLSGLRVLYVGEGNNTASALARAAAKVPGLAVTFAVPEGYGLPEQLVRSAHEEASREGGLVEQCHDVGRLGRDVDVVYTTRWQTTGTSKSDPAWRERFEPFRVDDAFLRRFPGALFMHDLPAHRGDEVTGDVLDGPRSIAWSQARMKLYSAMAVLAHVFARPLGDAADRIDRTR